MFETELHLIDQGNTPRHTHVLSRAGKDLETEIIVQVSLNSFLRTRALAEFCHSSFRENWRTSAKLGAVSSANAALIFFKAMSIPVAAIFHRTTDGGQRGLSDRPNVWLSYGLKTIAGPASLGFNAAAAGVGSRRRYAYTGKAMASIGAEKVVGIRFA